MSYDPQNIFAKILRGEIPCNKVYEDNDVLAFNDIAPQASVHILVVPKGPYQSFDDFTCKAGPQQQLGFYKAVQSIAEQQGLRVGGYRLVCNHGMDSNQEVAHFHVHLLGGENLGPLITR